MRILVLTYETPAYPAGGGASRQHSLLEPLAGAHQVKVLSTGGRPLVGSPPVGVEVELVDPGPEVGDPPQGWLEKNMRHYFAGPPWLFRTAMNHRAALAAQLPRVMADFAPDVVQVEHGEIEMLLDDIPDGPATVLTLHNILLARQYQDVFRDGYWSRTRAALELPVLARQSRRDMFKAGVTITTTERDRRLAHLMAPRATVRVVPNCINAPYFQRSGPRDPDPTAVFTGSFQYQPNADAAAELITEVWPAVRGDIPAARLRLAGQQVPAGLRRLAAGAPGVEVLDTPPDLRQEMWRAWLLAAPLRSGSGSPLKIIEGMAAGLPVVATSRVVDALGPAAGGGIEVAKSAPEFAAAIVNLLRDEGRRGAMSTAGVRASQGFDRAVAAPLLEAAWREAVEVTRRRHQG